MKKKIANLSWLISGTMISGSACGVGMYVGHSLNGTHINEIQETQSLAQYSGVLDDRFLGDPQNETLLTSFVTQHSLAQFNDLQVVDVNYDLKTFKVNTQQNSNYYTFGTEAICSWELPIRDGDWTQITGTLLSTNVKVFENTEVGRNEILSDIAIQFPDLDTNQLYIDEASFDQLNKSATIRTVTNSEIYDVKSATVMAGYVNSCEFYYEKSSLTQTVTTTGAPIFKFNDQVVTPTFVSITPSVAAPVSYADGVLSYTANTAFAGALYTITTNYVSDGYTFVSRANVYVEQFIPSTSSQITATLGGSLVPLTGFSGATAYVKDKRCVYNLLSTKSWQITSGSVFVTLPVKITSFRSFPFYYFSDSSGATMVRANAAVSGNNTVFTYYGGATLVGGNNVYCAVNIEFDIQ